ncbi:uncharacterized protein BDW70DRAFT_149544 [Aspergillus foveolatus]|uniref:uncharacterized protein n=1 Tax=Aspergillus foveolatus TaxID=210207 RepID=UPI003CCDB34C
MATTATGDLPHDNLQVQAIGMIFAFPAVATVAVLLRAYIRLWTRSFAADDWVICVAGILYWGETVTSYFVIKYNYVGYHIWDVPSDWDSTPGAKFSYATELLYNPILALIKTSILLFLLRLTGQKKAVRRTIIALLVLNAIAAVATFLITTFNCLPVASNWDPDSYPDKRCINFADFVTGTASVSIFTDFLVLLMPTWIVYNLHIAKKQKIMLIGILSFGLITVLAGIIRVILLDNFDRHIPADSTYSVLFCLSTIEVGLAFVAACAPALKPLFMRLLPKLFNTNSRSGQYNNHARPGTSSRWGYDLDALSRSRRTMYHDGSNTATTVEAGEGGGSSGAGKRDINGEGKGKIMLTTETEVKWHDHEVGGSSTESLVQARGRR